MGISGETAFPVFTVWKAERLNKAMIRKDGNNNRGRTSKENS